ncbi:hypothetical protein E3Q23_02424 [Wallemia mellicola]|uniref:isoleucine--tRNA ligase n=1 Tax=Wallemia mellicola TaxID=1708541 RepID=A0A4T0LZ09_9BASI|nr:hypothetical protein E3Q23_02424 [Wallemia mellicola]TIC64644.1 isoleucyl-tRNA synthetase [Wallemia mellicola]
MLRCTNRIKNQYKSTINLPITDFPIRPNPSTQASLFNQLTTKDLYNWQRSSRPNKSKFILHDGPPYANGNLHLGHALNKILKDIITRYNLLANNQIDYRPGWDCHGLPIELKSLSKLKTRDPLSVRTSAKQTALDGIDLQKIEFNQFGLLADLYDSQSTYRTLDLDYELRQLRLFSQLLKQGLIFRAFKPVYWSPSSQTALAESELEYNDNHVSDSVYISFPLTTASEKLQQLDVKDVNLLCWTTTPWSLVGNMGVCVHPDLEYVIVEQLSSGNKYLIATERLEAMGEILGEIKQLATISGIDLAGSTYTPPFHAQNAAATSFPIITAKHVSADTGTGLVHTAAAHGHDDYIAVQQESKANRSVNDDNLHASISQSVNTPILNPVDHQGRFDSEQVRRICGQDDGSALDGLDCLGEGSKVIINLLESRGGWIVAKEKVKHRYPYDWRTKKPVLIRATSQWFANVDKLKERSIKALEDVNFIPSSGRHRLESFILGRSEWCISRQRAWGVPIPIIFDAATKEPLLDDEVIEHTLKVLSERGTNAWWTDPAKDFLPDGIDKDVVKGLDTMDVWFDSGTSWMCLDKRVGKPRADVYLEGSDQHRGWFQSSLLTAVAAGEGAPYKTLITHGMVVDELGRKMSKSLGNGLSPLDIINGTKSMPKYGIDVLRFWAASVEYTKDVPIGPTIIAQASDSLKKIRNAARFILGNLKAGEVSSTLLNEKELPLIDRWMLNQLHIFEKACRQAYDQHIFSKVVQTLLNFTSGPLATYFEITKDCLYNDSPNSHSRLQHIYVLQKTLDLLTKSVAPITPYLSEELNRHNKNTEESIFKSTWAVLDDYTHEEAAEPASILLGWRNEVLNLLETLRSEKIIKTSLEATVDVFVGAECSEATRSVLDMMNGQLAKAFVVSSVQVHDVEDRSACVEASKRNAQDVGHSPNPKQKSSAIDV